MKPTLFAVAMTLALAATTANAGTDSYVGIVSDSMCKHDHIAMKMGPDPECIRGCVRHGNNVKYVLLVGKESHLLSDQQTPQQFAGKKVRVTGALNAKSNVIAVSKMEATN
jgi:hypothetical protein